MVHRTTTRPAPAAGSTPQPGQAKRHPVRNSGRHRPRRAQTPGEECSEIPPRAAAGRRTPGLCRLRDEATNEAAVIDLNLLAEAVRCAREADRDLWQFAVEIAELHQVGLTNSRLRHLLCTGLLEHREETTRPEDGRRSFRCCRNLRLTDRTCFVLSPTGLKALGLDFAGRPERPLAEPLPPPGLLAGLPEIPRWDAALRELWYDGMLVKRYKVPAPNQEAVLAGFEAVGWPACIPDPMLPEPDQVPAERLRETIKSLNRNQVRPLIKFSSNGLGTGVVWKRWPAPPAGAGLPARRADSRRRNERL